VTFPAGQEEFPAVCPYLGLADDADSHATFATEAHRCYRLENPTRIASPHQESYCLGANHTTCPVYRGEGIGGAAPAAAVPPVTVQGPAREPRGRPPREQKAPPPPRPGRAPGRPSPERPVRAGGASPRPRAGGISMPVATIGLFALAIIVIAIAFLIQQAVGGDDGKLSPADVVATNQAQKTQSPVATQGNQTKAPTGTPGTATGSRTAGATGTAATTGTPGTTTATKTPGAGGKTYVVKAGDFCGTIAESQGVTLQALLDANKMTEADCTKLQPGQELKIP